MVRVNQLSHTGLANDKPELYISDLSNISEDGEDKTYWMLETDGRYSYIYDTEPGSIDNVGRRIGGSSRKKRMHRRIFNAGKRTPLVYRLMPSTSKISINVPESFEFDFGVIGHKASFINTNDSVLLMGPEEALYRDESLAPSGRGWSRLSHQIAGNTTNTFNTVQLLVKTCEQ